MKSRNEWKYLCSDSDLAIIENKLRNILRIDENSEGSSYNIHSLYFDDINNDFAFANDAGINRRYKWRIRFYNSDTHYIKLEKKIKIDDRCYKLSQTIDLETYQKITNNNLHELLFDKRKLVQEFAVDISSRFLKPCLIIDYERKAYIEPISNIRITIDQNISTSDDVDRFLYSDYTKLPVLEKKTGLLEVKFDDLLPSHIVKACVLKSLNKCAFSKYYFGRIKIGGIKQ